MAEKKQYRVPLVWSVYGHLWIEAESEDEAKEIALDAETPLPEGDYTETIDADETALLLEKIKANPDLMRQLIKAVTP